MKLITCILTTAILSLCTTTYAENLAKNLTQENNAIVLTMQKGDMLSINFDLERYPIFRQSEWFSYVLKCESSEKSKISYSFKGQDKVAYSRIMLSNGESDGQLVCHASEGQWCTDDQINTKGVLTIENISGLQNNLKCNLYPKIGE